MATTGRARDCRSEQTEEGPMSTTDVSSDKSAPTPNPEAGQWRLEVVGLPVSDV